MFKALYVGGNANNSVNAGLLYTNANNSATNTNTNIEGQLNVGFSAKHKPHLLVKNKRVRNRIGSESEDSNRLA